MRRTPLYLLLSLAFAQSGEGEPAAGRFASLVSRDSKLYLWTDDRSAFLRRARRVALIRELAQIAPPEFPSDLADAGSNLSMFLSTEMFLAIPSIAGRGSGELALSVEGYILDRGQTIPDILVLADATGFEGLVKRLAMLVDQPERSDSLLAPFRLPFGVNAERPVQTHVHRGVTIAQFETSGGHTVALAESGGVLYGARSSQRVEMALDRAIRKSLGSLADSVRFQVVVRQAAPKPGSLFWYADLRRMRDPRSVHLLRECAGRDLLVETLSAYDGIGLTLRGSGETFEFRAFLERAAGTRSPGQSVPRQDAPFLTPARLPATSVAAATWRADAAQAGALLCSWNRYLGGVWSPEVVQEYILALLGKRETSQIAARLNGEFAVVMPQRVRASEILPRLVFMLQTDDALGLNRWLSHVAQRSSPASFRQITLGQDIYFLISLPQNGYLTELAMTVSDGWLLASPKIVHLRWFVAQQRKQSTRLDQSEGFLRPMDRLDFKVDQPVSGLAFAAGTELADGVAGWLAAGLRVHPLLLQNPSRALPVARVARLLLDPDLAASFRGLGVRCRSTPEGVLIDGSGP